MAPPAPPNRGRRLRLAVAGAVVVTALTVASTGASPPSPMGDATAMGAARLGASSSQDSRPRTPAPGFLLDRGRTIKFDAPRASIETAPSSVNNHGQIAGFSLDDPVTLAGARGSLLAKGVKGPFTPIEVPGAPRNVVEGLNDRGSLVGAYENTDTPGPSAAS